MRYEKVQMATFLERPNRFIARCRMFDGSIQESHVPNTGRCRELLVPGCRVFLRFHDDPRRKTRHTLIAVDKNGLLINMDSQAPNRVAAEYLPALLPGLSLLRPETRFGASRFDFYAEAGDERWFVEVKGVTLERDGEALFPDAPTQRGTRHLRELAACLEQGYRACVLFVVQMDGIRRFLPNQETDPAFAQALREGAQRGVRVEAASCAVTPESLEIQGKVPVFLGF